MCVCRVRWGLGGFIRYSCVCVPMCTCLRMTSVHSVHRATAITQECSGKQPNKKKQAEVGWQNGVVEELNELLLTHLIFLSA